MRELLRNAVNGWLEYTDAGKYAVLFLGILLGYWYLTACVGHTRERQRLMIYASVMAAAAICPVTAVVLMKYQTKFYDYKWIWSVVPVTPVIAYGATKQYLDLYRRHWRGKVLKPACLVAVGLAVIFLCGNLYTDQCEGAMEAQNQVKTAKLLDKLAEAGDTEDICLWAPSDILAHVRGLNGEIRLLYGRNMWDAALNAYSYDVYDRETIALYEWMEGLETDQAAGEDLTAQVRQAARMAVESALGKGVNCIMIPQENAGVVSDCVSDAAEKMNLTVTQEVAEGYYIYRLRS